MTELHLDITHLDGIAFHARTSAGDDGSLVAVVGADLLRVVSQVVWFKNACNLVTPSQVGVSIENLLMFLSDIRKREFKEGIFLGDDVLHCAEVFRLSAKTLAQGAYLPTVTFDGVKYLAQWQPLQRVENSEDSPFYAWCVDQLARRAQRTVLEDGSNTPETIHDAWLVALRSTDPTIKWSNEDEIKEFIQTLKIWTDSLQVSQQARQELCFELVPSSSTNELWQLRLKRSPTTRLGLISLGQAAQVYTPLIGMKQGVLVLDKNQVEHFFNKGALALRQAGYNVSLPENIIGEHITLEAELTSPDTPPKNISDSDAKSISTQLIVRVDGEVVDEHEIQFLLDQGSTMVFFRNRWIEVNRSILKEALRALQITQPRTMSVQKALRFAYGLGNVGKLRVAHFKAHGWLRGLLNELSAEERFKVLPTPAGFKGKLRAYQQRGFSWLAFLTKWGFGACLADDMGLGKTIQTIAFLAYRKQVLGIKAPALVVAPISVVTNWVREFRTFAPKIKVLLHYGALRSTGISLATNCAKFDVVITGYSLLVRDIRYLSEIQFSAVVFDEAQVLKNFQTKVAYSARSLQVPVKVALTGTPFENSVNDLWSLEELLNPGLLGTHDEFESTFSQSLKVGGSLAMASRLRHVLEPFILRRLKQDSGIAEELGPRREIREYIPLTSSQRLAYEQALVDFRTRTSASEIKRGQIFALITQLKLICDGAGKFLRLDDLLTSIFAQGESCLIFTQYAKIGKMIRAHLLEKFGVQFPFLHGSLSSHEREEQIENFNSSKFPNAFILSLKAGGYGLNLTRATHVIHFDRWWNPAVENQASDRAHRIGQTNTVFIHLFICSGTLEDYIDTILEQKRTLADELIGNGENFLLKMGLKDLERIVALDGTGTSHKQK